MASGPLLGGGGGGDGSREKNRWAESKVYTRKSHNKASKLNSNPNPQPNPAVNNPQQHLPAAPDDVNSSLHQPAPPAPPVPPSAPSDDDASSLNHRDAPALQPHKGYTGHQVSNGHYRRVTIGVASRPRHEVRELRRKLTAELEQVRALVRKLEARELQLAASAVPSISAPGYTLSQLSASDPNTPTPAKRAPTNSEAASAAPLRRQFSVSVPPGPDGEAMEKEKRTPKANQLYRNSDFILGKEKFPTPESNKKAKADGGKKHPSGEPDHSSAQKLYGSAFRSCSALLAKIMKHKFSWVFNTPVDVKGLGLHDYYTIIKHPMDLGTVKSRLTKNWYKHPREFAEDVRLTFRNAMTYNPKGQDVHFMAEQLSQMFEEKWPAIDAECTYVSYHPPPKKAPPPPPPPIDVRTLERSDSTIHPLPDSRTPKPVSYTPHGRPPALKKPKAKEPNKRDMTFEEKQRLSNNLQNLPSEKLDNIVQIIKKRNSSLSQHDDEIEVDIDSVDAETLWELDRFVTNYKKSLSKNKRKAELAILARQAAPHDAQERAQERVPEPVVAEVPKGSKTVVDEKCVASSSPVGGERKGDNGSGSSSSSTSSSDSGSSSSDSDSESSSACGSDAAHSPRT